MTLNHRVAVSTALKVTPRRGLALGYAANKFRFNTVSPGVTNTPMHAKDNHAALAKFHPLGRMGEVSDIVDAVLYPQNATFVAGENIRVDEGTMPVDYNANATKPGSSLRQAKGLKTKQPKSNNYE